MSSGPDAQNLKGRTQVNARRPSTEKDEGGPLLLAPGVSKRKACQSPVKKKASQCQRGKALPKKDRGAKQIKRGRGAPWTLKENRIAYDGGKKQGGKKALNSDPTDGIIATRKKGVEKEIHCMEQKVFRKKGPKKNKKSTSAGKELPGGKVKKKTVKEFRGEKGKTTRVKITKNFRSSRKSHNGSAKPPKKDTLEIEKTEISKNNERPRPLKLKQGRTKCS